MTLNSKKKVIKNQKYESYWHSTMALTNFNGFQFIHTLQLMIEHIDKYNLSKLKMPQTKDDSKKVRTLIHRKELEKTIASVFKNDSSDGLTTRKQMNEFIKLGFIKPYLISYTDNAKLYVDDSTSKEERKRIFTDTVYEYSSFNSSVTTNDTNNNQIKFLVNTLINRAPNKDNVRSINLNELKGLMLFQDVSSKSYASEKDIRDSESWAIHDGFGDRKYNQISHLKSIINNLNFLEVITKKDTLLITLSIDAKKILPDGDTKRDPYRFANMRHAVLEKRRKIYGRDICWLTKQQSEGLVVSHIFASAKALRARDTDAAYDPNNALLLKPGDVDQYFDKKKITINASGTVVFSPDVREDFRASVISNSWHIDKVILNPKRLKYLKMHNKEFTSKYNLPTIQ